MQAIWHGRLGDDQRDCVIRIAAERRTGYVGEVRYRRTLGYRLRIELQSSIRTQVFFVRAAFARNAFVRWIYKLRRQVTLDAVPESLDGFVAVTIDPAWTRQLLTESKAVDATARLLKQGASPTLAGSACFMPSSDMGKFRYASPILPLEAITDARVQAVLDDMQQIARGAEQLPAPEVVREVSAFGRFAEQHPWAIAVALLLGLMGVVAFGALLLVLTALALNGLMR